MVKERSCGGVIVVAVRTTVTMARALSLGPMEAMEPMNAVWTTVKATSCHFSWCRREQMKTTMRPAATAMLNSSVGLSVDRGIKKGRIYLLHVPHEKIIAYTPRMTMAPSGMKKA